MDTRPLRMLSGGEVVDRGRNVADCILPEVGTKEVTANGSWLEAKQIQTALEARKKLVAAERIDKLGALSHAEWRESLRQAEVTQQVGGHWQYMGHNVNGTLLLLPEEALYLMETNGLLLKHNQVTVSLQKAYNLLLDNEMTLTQYKVYASLSRVGYKVFRYDKRKLTTDDSMKSKMLQKEKDVAKTDSNDSDNRKKIDLPTPILRMDTSSTNESILPLVQLPSDDNTSTKESDQPLPPNDNIPLDLPSRQHDDTAMKMINNETATLLDMPLLSDDNTSYEESQMTSDQPPLKPGDTSMKIINEEITTLSDPPQSNKTFTIKSNHLSVKKTKDSHLPKDSQLPKDSHLPNGNEKVTMNGTGLVTSYSKATFSIDELGVIRLETQKFSADVEMDTVSSSKSDFKSTKTDANNSKSTDSDGQLLNSYKVMKHKLQTRKIQPSDPKSMQDKLNNIPDFCNQQVVTVNVPSEEYLPRNVFLNNTAYVLDLKILKHNKRRNSIPETTSSGNRAMNRTIKNSSESDIPLHEAIPTPEMPQVFPNTPFFQQQFGYYPSWRPRFHPFQRPMFPAHRFNQQPYFYRMPNFMPHRFNARPPPYMFNQNHDQRKRQRRNVRHDHLHAIRNLAQRLKQFTTPNYVLRSALISLLKRFNEIYNERMQITPDFDIIGDKQIETIEIEDDETPTKKAKIDTKKFNKVLDNVKTLAARLKNLERKTQSTSKQKRAFCNLLKNFNKAFDADFSLNTKGDLIDNKLVVIDSSSDSDVVATEDIDTNKTKKRSSNSAEHYDKKNKKRKILCNPFSILKKVNEGASTSQAFENIAVERKSTDLLKYFNKYWLRDDDDFGKAAVCSKTDARYLLNDSQQMYEFMDDPRAFDNWSDLKLAFCVHMDAVFAFEHDLTAHSRNLTMDKSRLKPLLQTETADDWESSLDMLRIIKTNTDVQETSLTVHFDVYNRDVQNFRKTDPPKPHFRIVCVEESLKFPSGAEMRALHAKHDDGITIVFAVVSGGSVTYLQMNPKDLPVYVGND